MSAAIDARTGVAFPDRIRLLDDPMNRAEAEHVTDQINTHAIRLVQVVVEAKRGSAHLAMGCKTWDEYCDKHLRITRQYAGCLLRYQDKLDDLAAWTGIPAELFNVSERGTRALETETMVSIGGDAATAALGDGADEVEAAAAASKAIKDAAKAQQSASHAVTAAARRRCVEHLTADLTLSVQALAKAAGASVDMAQDVWDELEPLRLAAALTDDEREAAAFARGEAAANADKPSDPGDPTLPESDAPEAPAASGATSPEPAPLDGTPGKAGAVDETVTAATEGSEGDGSAAVPLAENSAPAPVPDLWEQAPLDHAMTLAALFDLDPHEAATRLTDEQAPDVCALVDDLADWCHRFDQARLTNQETTP